MEIVERTEERLIVHHKPWNAWFTTAFAAAVGVLIVSYGIMNDQPVLLASGVGVVIGVPLLTAHLARPIWVTFDRMAGSVTMVHGGVFGERARQIPLEDVTGVECSDFVGRPPRSMGERFQLNTSGRFVVRLTLASGKTLTLASLQSCERGEHNQLAQAIRSFLGVGRQTRVA